VRVQTLFPEGIQTVAGIDSAEGRMFFAPSFPQDMPDFCKRAPITVFHPPMTL
jgi:hypothetical protein